MIKKKTVSDKILESLRSDVVQADTIGEDSCGICLDVYEVGQVRKLLPCGHRFHSECITEWLSNQSTDCPLDKMPVDEAMISQYEKAVTDSVEEKESDDEEIRACLDELIDQIEISNSVEECVSELVTSVETTRETFFGGIYLNNIHNMLANLIFFIFQIFVNSIL